MFLDSVSQSHALAVPFLVVTFCQNMFTHRSAQICMKAAVYNWYSREKMAKTEFLMKWALRPIHRQTRWGLHQRGWSNDASATPQRRSRHELAWISTDFLSEQRRATDFVETAGRAGGKRQPARCSRKTQVKFAMALMASKEASAPLHRRACTSAYAFIAESAHAFQQVFLSTMHVQVCTLDRCFEHQRKHLRTHSLQDVHMRSCMCSLFI